jgi:hypothetical protein
MAMVAVTFKPGTAPCAARLVMLRFPCNRMNGLAIPGAHRTAMIDRQIEVPTSGGHARALTALPARGGSHPWLVAAMAS